MAIIFDIFRVKMKKYGRKYFSVEGSIIAPRLIYNLRGLSESFYENLTYNLNFSSRGIWLKILKIIMEFCGFLFTQRFELPGR